MTLEIILLVMATLGIYEGARLSKTVLLFVDPVGPGWYLVLMSCLLFVCAIALLVQKFIRRKAAHREVSISLHKGAAGRALILLILYAVAVTFLGYVIASAIFFILVQRIFGERSWIRCAVIGVAVTGCFYFVFSYLAGMPLP
jgi:putative tricarboxylic transport membrane protein